MRDRETIEREMYVAREDLEENLAELKHAVREKVDIPARARKALGETKQQARDMFVRGKDGAKTILIRGKDSAIRVYNGAVDTTRERPLLVSLIAAAIVGATVAAIFIYRAHRRTWFDRFVDALP